MFKVDAQLNGRINYDLGLDVDLWAYIAATDMLIVRVGYDSVNILTETGFIEGPAYCTSSPFGYLR
jgi:hypothetical protein